MDVKTVFKVILGTILIIGLGTFVTELYNASVNGALMRQKIDAAAESSLNYYTQESFRQEGSYSTVNLPNFASDTDPATIYVSGHFYDNPGDPVRQVSEMFEWYPGSTTAKGYDVSKAFPVYKAANLGEGDTYTYLVTNSLGQQMGFRMTVKRLPAYEEATRGTPYNYVAPLTQAAWYKHSGAFMPGEHLGIVNRYASDVMEMRNRTGQHAQNLQSYSTIVDYLESQGITTDSGNDSHATAAWEQDILYELGAVRPLEHVYSAVEEGYTPFNVGFPLFSWQLNSMFKWNLVAAFVGVGIDSDSLAATNTYETPAISEDENGIPCVRWNGFNIYADQARITNIDYYAYNLYDDTDLVEFCNRAGLVREDVEDLKQYAITGLDGYGYANTVVTKSGNPCCFVEIVEIQYDVPVAYRGMTPFRQVINWATSRNADGYEGFKGGTYAHNPENYTYTTTTLSGSGDDAAFTLESSLQYVMMP